MKNYPKSPEKTAECEPCPEIKDETSSDNLLVQRLPPMLNKKRAKNS